MRLRLLLDHKRRAIAIGIMLLAVIMIGLLAAGPIMASSGTSVSGVPPIPAIPWRSEYVDTGVSAAHGTDPGHDATAASADDHASDLPIDLKTIAFAGAQSEPVTHEGTDHADASHEPASHDGTDQADSAHEPAAHEEADHADAEHEPAAHDDAGHGDSPEQESAAHGHGAEAQPVPAATRGLVLGGFGAVNGLVIAVASVLKRKATVATGLRRDAVAGTLPAGDAQ